MGKLNLDELKEEVDTQDTEGRALKKAVGDIETRHMVAKTFVRYYFWILILIVPSILIYDYFVYRLTHNVDLIVPLKDILLTYSAVVGPTFGLVVAYYFKGKD